MQIFSVLVRKVIKGTAHRIFIKEFGIYLQTFEISAKFDGRVLH